MLKWLRRLLGKDDPLKRGLFVYYDGKAVRVGDPLELDALFKKHGGDEWPNWLAVLSATNQPIKDEKFAKIAAVQRGEAVTKLVELARLVFGIASAASGGLSGSECLGVLAKYLVFLADLQERFRPLPNLPARPASSPKVPDMGESSPATSTSPN